MDGFQYNLAQLFSLSLYKFLDWSKSETLADDKIIVTQKWNFFGGLVENIVGKGENAAFSPFHSMFSKGFIFKVV